jgi:two-component system LytT family sensor kinase
MISYKNLNIEQKIILSEIIYILLIVIVSPFLEGYSIWKSYPFTFSLIFVNFLQLPSIILFYRLFLPKTLMKGKIGSFLLLLPLYLLIYELNIRLAAIITVNAPFIPTGYQNLLTSADAHKFSWSFNQSFSYTCLILLTATSLAMVRQLFNQQQEVYFVNLQKVKLELAHLKSQLQPHFFFNTLNNLYALSVQKSDKAPVMIANLSNIMRYVLYESRQEHISLEKELDFIENYVELEKLRYDNPNAIDFSIQGNRKYRDIEPLLFLPLIENCFKHALQNGQPEEIKMVFLIDEKELIFQTSNKINTTSTMNTNEGGIGLANIKKRLDLLYPNKHNLSIDLTHTTFNVVLTIHF